MPTKEYFFQQKKTKIARKFFETGFSVVSAVLIALKEAGEGILEEIPDYYFIGARELLGVGKYKKVEIKKQTLRVNLSRMIKQGLIGKDVKRQVYGFERVLGW